MSLSLPRIIVPDVELSGIKCKEVEDQALTNRGARIVRRYQLSGQKPNCPNRVDTPPYEVTARKIFEHLGQEGVSSIKPRQACGRAYAKLLPRRSATVVEKNPVAVIGILTELSNPGLAASNPLALIGLLDDLNESVRSEHHGKHSRFI